MRSDRSNGICPNADAADGRKDDQFRWIDAIACAIGYGCGVGMVPVLMGYLVRPMQSELKLPTAVLSFGSAVVFVSSLTAPFAGRLVDKLGVLPCLILGHLALVLGLAVAGLAPVSYTWLIVAATLILISAPLCYSVSYAAAISLLFRSRQGLAFGLAFGGTSFVTMGVAPLITAAADRIGWQAGAGVMALVAGIGGGLALSWLARPLQTLSLTLTTARSLEQRTPPSAQKEPAVRGPLFWLLTAGLAISLVPLGGFIGQMQPFLSERGFSSEDRVTIGIVYAAAILVGRLCGGLLLDRTNGSVLVPCAVFVSAAVGALLMRDVTQDSRLIVPLCAVVLLGAASGAEIDFAAYYCLKAFGHARYAENIGAIVLFSGLGFALGGYAFAVGYDLSGDYTLSAIAAALLFLTAAAIFLCLRRPMHRAHARQAAVFTTCPYS